MKLLLKREQTDGRMNEVKFKLWAKIETDDNERALMKRYKFDQAVLFGVNDPELRRRAIFYGVIAFFAAVLVLSLISAVLTNLSSLGGSSYRTTSIGIAPMQALILSLLVAGAFGFWYHNENREKILVRDLIHGRHFSCPSIIDLTKQEAKVREMTAIFRQVMESAKHWGGTQTEDIPVLSRDEARELILKVF